MASLYANVGAVYSFHLGHKSAIELSARQDFGIEFGMKYCLTAATSGRTGDIIRPPRVAVFSFRVHLPRLGERSQHILRYNDSLPVHKEPAMAYLHPMFGHISFRQWRQSFVCARAHTCVYATLSQLFGAFKNPIKRYDTKADNNSLNSRQFYSYSSTDKWPFHRLGTLNNPLHKVDSHKN
jgi:hypothetical protein